MAESDKEIKEYVRQVILETMDINLAHDKFYEEALKKELFERWKKIEKCEQEILSYRYGLISGERHTEKETGEQFGIEPKVVRQIEFKVLGRRQRALNAEKLDEYLRKLREKEEKRRWKYQW